MSRRRSAAVSVTIVAALSVAMTGCGPGQGPDHQGVCVDRTTNKRVKDSDCDDQRSGSRGWYYYGRGASVPPVGGSATGGSWTTPGGGTVARGGAPAKGGVVARGGFGGGKGGSVGG